MGKLVPYHVFLFGLVILVVVACNRKVQPEVADPFPIPEDVEIEAVSEVDEATIDTTVLVAEEEVTMVLSLAKTPCYGDCPVYSVKVYSDKSVVYQGTRSTNRIGFFKSSIPAQNFQEIQDRADAIQFFDLSHKFPEEGRFIADIPNTVIGMDNGEGWHEVVINYGAPDALLEYVAYLDDFFDSLPWTSIPNPLNSPDE